MEHKQFHYHSLDDVRAEAERNGAFIPLSENIESLSKPLSINGKTVPNRIVIQPMEGCDGTRDGTPDELTLRRYERFASGGAGLIWFEAVAVSPESRANPKQLMLTENNLDEYKKLVENIRETAMKQNETNPLIIMQATHSGRYSRPDGPPKPIIVYNSPVYEKDSPLNADCIASDAYLDTMPMRYAESTRLCREAGFDGVDVKACHRYLVSELFSARTRENSKYGGSFENRVKLFLDLIKAAQSGAERDFIVTTRFNVFDGADYPYGFGINEHNEMDLSEPVELVRLLKGLGIDLFNVTIGNPYVNPHVNRPFDKGFYTPPEHPLEGLGRMYTCVKAVKDAAGESAVIVSGLSYLRHFSSNVAAGLIKNGAADLVGYGREAFAYPCFARDIFQKGAMDKNKCCITCGKCTELMRAGKPAGCVIRDEVYAGIYKEVSHGG